MEEREFAEKVKTAGGRAFLVGGYVRDLLLGREPKDRDYVISGIKEQAFRNLFPEAKQVGRSFPVFLQEIEGSVCEIAFARRERKSGRGYLGFSVEYPEDVTIEEDLYRRDTRMNSMALELPDRTLVDPYGGEEDLRRHVIRAVSSHFLEDPVRALRAARQAAELGWEITEDTVSYMVKCRDELGDEPPERILGELQRALAAPRPSVFFRSLRQAGLLETAFPEIHQLIGKTQPKAFHPEGDAFEHSMQVLDAVSSCNSCPEVRFAALCHDLGKGTTPAEMLPHHYGHEIRGPEVLSRWNERMTLPKLWCECAVFAMEQHMRASRLTHPGKIVELLLDIHRSKLPLQGFLDIVAADHGSLVYYLEHGGEILEILLEVSGKDAPSDLVGKQIAKWIRDRQIRLFMKWQKEFFGT